MNAVMVDQAPMAVWNGVVRFGIEVAALVGLAAGGWAMALGSWRWVLAFGLPLAAAVAWGTFRVSGDPGPAPVAVSGWVRLVLETVVLGGGTAGFVIAFGEMVGIACAVVVVSHYAVAWERVGWLLER
jgi:hypothetical protein